MARLELTDFFCGPLEGESFPLVLRAQDEATGAELNDILDWLRRDRHWLDRQLLAYGALLFRGLRALRAVDDFEAFAQVISPRMMDYTGGVATRSLVKGSISTSTDAPPSFPIAPHQELSYQTEVPDWVLLFCEVPPTAGGQTPLVDMRAVYRELSQDVKESFERKGLQLHRFLPGKPSGPGRKSWNEVFGTHDRQEVDRIAAERSWRIEWLPGGDLRMANESRPPSLAHPVTGEPVWFNQANLLHPSAPASDLWHEGRFGRSLLAAAARRLRPSLFHYEMKHADGSPIRATDLSHVRAVMRDETVVFDWQRGDLLWLDNYLVAHGRRTFAGERRILAALLRDPDRSPAAPAHG
jgi:alpha-ketoglutarate-dependent taurine dioxygenase